MNEVSYVVGDFLGQPEIVTHIVPDVEIERNCSGNGEKSTAGHSSVTANERRTCGQSQKSSRQKQN